MGIQKLLKDNFLIFDGAMGTMLQREGLKAGELPEAYNINFPEVVYNIHRKYIEAGADIITTNTFGANRFKLKDSPYTVEGVVKAAVNIAKKAAEDKLVALDIGATGKLMQPYGTLSFNDAYDVFKEQVIAGKAAGADVILIETISDIYEARAAILAAKENSDLPVFCTLTFQENKRTLMGTDATTMVQVFEGLGVDVLGVNCSLGPKQIQPIVDEILKIAVIPVMIQPNAGLPKLIDGETIYDLTAPEFAKEVNIMAEKGVSIFGGCCGTDPNFIRTVKENLKGLKPKKIENKRLTAACSSKKTVILGESVKIIGERINPTGKKKLKEALRNNDIDYIISEAIVQKETGSDILDINLGLPEIDEKEMMRKVVIELQSLIDLPLQIDSVKADVIEEAVRIYNGKAIINSVNGKTSSMEKIFPIAKKYGACVIGLTLDEEGLPKTAEKRLKIASKIIETAKTYGIPEENIIIDCLVLTASAAQESVMETLKAIPMIKSKYNVKTVLGASNVSFGLPNRKIINATYLALALGYGLDAPITDSTSEILMDTIRSFKILANQDKECKEFIEFYSKTPKNDEKKNRIEKDLKQIIIDGMKEEAQTKTKELLENTESMEIVDSYLIPALDIVGERYEREEIFLPQLIRSAETVKGAFDVIKDKLIIDGKDKISKGRIILATVKGDIHDIGKNIVKILLENYGFEVIDLGKDVPIEDIVNTAKKEDIRLVGLSALMTTTVKAMEETIRELKKQHPDCFVMVGGAVLNKEYAEMIGAHYYGKDARESVNIAKKFFKV
ncbi:homocysteine S-methyltransferase family protein [Paramaledivibacter caminithermalis]|uniref:Methionine synthase n=1 Tax=Paramaledivibacter caminithermalis (strain DSM 15212 / CIP 107654 / DViRD3) TaxID=1121301 RepID=A0A1M6LJ98_PARC5|nr:homocysteine S-methyltransferase family protein [Paramaledivibacter caminithermalis]SHJ71249.1 5-methyltetrahydrofolate--homocysteine methyltransferase [Paramaledivibacter caminithermalis DSM 15212]